MPTRVVGPSGTSLPNEKSAEYFSTIPTIAAILIAMFTVLPWPSSADEDQVWARCRVSGPPQTPAHRSSQSNGAGVSGSGFSGSASDDDDDGAGSGGSMGFGSHGANVSETRSVMKQASSRQTDEDAAFQADMQDLELLASLG